ncbi:MAG: hypothetical protein WBE06_00940 [Phycisphaerae bacterium]
MALALWLVLAFWSASPACADLIGINFHGGTYGRKIGAKTAGVEPQVNWNDVGWWTVSDLRESTGQVTGVSVTTTTTTYTYNSYVKVDPPDGGNDYLMRGYIYTSGASLTVTIAGLEPPFTTDHYDVIVYFDGNNASADWITQYTLSVDGGPPTTLYGKDAKTASWNGTFVEGFGTSASDATPGNYVRFTGLTSGAFTLTATPVAGSGAINAIQIISAPEPASLALVVLGVVAALANRPRQSRFRR